ncbi:sigma-70 family RNA polymerase sigma factor [Paractinoplanes durhamensis]|uniref:RNA polymerase sigma factor SigL n=1 Tax=Paractinoplanes durhamensis TaxID=113563 RepID=A0ABQ3Z2Y9_9ACTN|nr:sigma-70 family RNA polymerase sigma factor [Actinoplanes durhamensis]GIE04187.1 RNA polymerase sigma factor SigL [Actinoplanes durhamensis]
MVATTVPETADGRAAEVMRGLHDAHAEAVLRFLLKLSLGDRQLAEDLLQETMVRAWRSIESLDTEPETQRRWLFIVGRRVAIDAARARQARPAEVGALDLTRMPAEGDAAERVVAAHTVHKALPRISAEHRAVLTALYFRGLSPAEIAGALGIPEGTVKSRTHYALRALRAAIGAVDGT